MRDMAFIVRRRTAPTASLFSTRLGYQQFESTLGATLNGEVQANVATATARGYENTLAYFLSETPTTRYQNLVEVINDRIDVLHRYFELRARMLDVDDLGYHDIYPPLVETDVSFPIEATREAVMESVKVLGSDYSGTFAGGFKERWMHVYPQPGKRFPRHICRVPPTTYIPWCCLIIRTITTASTYAHEWGHAMHQVLTNENQPYELADFSIFTTEIAAIANELLLQERAGGRSRKMSACITSAMPLSRCAALSTGR